MPTDNPSGSPAAATDEHDRQRQVLRADAAAPRERAAEGGRDGGRGRSIAVALLLVVACVAAPLAAAAIWLRNQVTDTDRYVRTVTPLAADADIRAAVAADVTRTLFARVDVAAEAEDVLPPRARFLAVPLASGVRRVTEDATARVLASDRFQQLWVEVNRTTHAQLVRVLTGEGDALRTQDGTVVLDLAPVLQVVKDELASREITIFDRVPAGAMGTSFVLLESRALERTQRGVRLLEALAVALPLLVVVCIGAAVALSRRRRRTVLQASLGIAASMVVLGFALMLARPLYLDQVAGPSLPEDAAASFFDIVVHWLRIGIRAIFAVALLVAAGAFLTGPSRAAAGIRRRVAVVVSWVAGETGVRSSAAGRWVGANRRALRVASILVPVVIFFLWSAPTPALLVLLIALALLSLLAIEIVGAGPAARA